MERLASLETPAEFVERRSANPRPFGRKDEVKGTGINAGVTERRSAAWLLEKRVPSIRELHNSFRVVGLSIPRDVINPTTEQGKERKRDEGRPKQESQHAHSLSGKIIVAPPPAQTGRHPGCKRYVKPCDRHAEEEQRRTHQQKGAGKGNENCPKQNRKLSYSSYPHRFKYASSSRTHTSASPSDLRLVRHWIISPSMRPGFLIVDHAHKCVRRIIKSASSPIKAI